MTNFRLTALASVINLALISIPNAEAASTQALERRIKELESRLKSQEQVEKRLLELESRLQKQVQPVATATAHAQTTPTVEKLNQKVNLLERQLEVKDEVAATAAARQPKVDAGSDGFKITSADGKHQLRLRGAVQTDARFYLGDSQNAGTDKFEVKQARIWIEGFLWKDLYYKIMPDFAASGNILPDAYVDYTYFNPASLLVGKYKPPLSLERLQGDSDTVFMERAFPTYFAINRDVGFTLHGSFAKPGYTVDKSPGPIDYKNFFTYQVGVFNGAVDDGSNNYNAPDINDDKEFVGRLWMHPFQHTGWDWLEGFGFGIAGTQGNPNNQTLQNQSTPIGRTVYLNYANTRAGSNAFTTPVANGSNFHIYPQLYWYAKGFGLQGEWVQSSQHLQSTNTVTSGGKTSIKTVNQEQNNRAWQVQVSYVLTGEDNSFGAIKPIQNFSPLDGKWGALQLAFRWTESDIDKTTFRILDPTKSAQHATAWTVGANWFLNPNALIRLDYEQVNFRGGAVATLNGGNRPDERVIGSRFQLAF
jgi:phosphate-selective porin OprO/OprP